MQVEELQKELETLKAKQQTQQAAEVGLGAQPHRHNRQQRWVSGHNHTDTTGSRGGSRGTTTQTQQAAEVGLGAQPHRHLHDLLALYTGAISTVSNCGFNFQRC